MGTKKGELTEKYIWIIALPTAHCDKICINFAV